MKDDTKLYGPYETSIVIHFTDDEQVASVTVTLSMGHPPSQADIDEAISEAQKEVPEGFRLLDKSEFFNLMMHQRLGATETFACPGNREWDTLPA